jgi:hypothetical protein
MKVLVKYIRLIGLISLILAIGINFLNTKYYSIGQYFLIFSGVCFIVVFTYLIIKTLFSKYVNL